MPLPWWGTGTISDSCAFCVCVSWGGEGGWLRGTEVQGMWKKMTASKTHGPRSERKNRFLRKKQIVGPLVYVPEPVGSL